MCLAVPRRLVSRADDGLTGTVDGGGASQQVSLALVPEAQPGQYVVVHLGMAMQTLEESEALEMLAELEALQRATDDGG